MAALLPSCCVFYVSEMLMGTTGIVVFLKSFWSLTGSARILATGEWIAEMPTKYCANGLFFESSSRLDHTCSGVA